MLIRSIARSLPVALAASLLVAGCAGGDLPAPADPTEIPAPPPMEVGPLALVPESYWTPPQTVEDAATVRVAGCEEALPCPGFVVLTGQAIPSDPNAAVLDDGVLCPGAASQEGGTLTPVGAALVETATVSVARSEATLTLFDVECATAEGDMSLNVQQRQWRAEGPAGEVLIVDRWTLDGLSKSLAEANWAA